MRRNKIDTVICGGNSNSINNPKCQLNERSSPQNLANVRSDSSKVLGLESRVSTKLVSGFDGFSAGVKNQQYQTGKLSVSRLGSSVLTEGRIKTVHSQ
jgi:hypothetical protein